MIFLDMRTIILSNVLTDTVCMLVIVLLWRQNRKRFAGTGFLVFDFALQTLALFLIILRGIIPDLVSIVLANTLVIAGTILGYMGLLSFVGKKGTQLHNYIFLVVFAGVHSWFTFVQPSQAARDLNISVGLLIICFQCAWLMLYSVPSTIRPLTRVVGIIFGAYCLLNIIRIVEFFLAQHAGTDYFHSGPFNTIVLVFYQMLFILLTYSLVLMFNKRLLTEVEKQEEKFSKAFHSSPYAIMITRASDGYVFDVNDGFVSITGYTAEEVKGKNTIGLRLWVSEEDRTPVINDLLQNSSVRNRELLFRIKSGEIITGLFSADIITINNEMCILSSIHDITELKKAEKELRETRDYLDNLLNYANAPIIVWDANFMITRFNKAFERLTGRTEAEITGKKVDILFPSGTREQSLEYIKKTNAGNRWEVVEIDIRHVDDSVRTLLWNSATIYLSDNKTVSATIAQGQDVTETKLAQKEIYRLNAELKQKVDAQTEELRNSQMALLNLVDDLNLSANKIVSVNQMLEATNKELVTFSYSVSHDLRAPLRSIDGFSSILLEDYTDKIDDDGKNYLERIRRATQHMGDLIDDMLNLSRVSQSEFFPRDFNLSTLVLDIASENQQKNKLKGFVLDIQDNVFVRADQRLMNIVMTNLLDNAFKFTGKTKQPRIQFGADIINGEKFIFVRDNGAGFDMAYADKLFGVFQRLHRSDEFPGTGIGLATVQRIINRHGGRIWAEGELGKGATFYFTLPE